jgi:TPR repeat protein
MREGHEARQVAVPQSLGDAVDKAGRGVHADRERALSLFKKACDAGMTMGCDAGMTMGCDAMKR